MLLIVKKASKNRFARSLPYGKPSDVSINLNAPRVSASLKMTKRDKSKKLKLKLKPFLTPMCHSERSAEDMQMARSKAKSLHGVELFLHGLV